MFSIVNRSVADRAISAITVGFAADPLVRWFYPEPKTFLAHFPQVIDLFSGRALDHKAAYCNDEFTATALWLPPGIHPDEDGLVALFEATVAADKRDRLFSQLEQMGRYHPDDPCWHLAMIAVDPAWQGKGLGSALLAEGLRQCDMDGLPAYLESTNPTNLSLYRRHGFEEIGLIEAEDAPPLFPMIRPPR